MPERFLSGDSLCWLGYTLLTISVCAPFWGYASLGAPACFAVACWVRHTASRTGELIHYDHATWLLHTVFLELFLYLVGVIALLFLFYGIGNDDSAMANLDRLEASMETLSSREQMCLLLRVDWVQLLLLGAILWWLLLAWPLKRLLHGMLALRQALAPRALSSSGRLLAVMLALFLQLLLLALSFL